MKSKKKLTREEQIEERLENAHPGPWGVTDRGEIVSRGGYPVVAQEHCDPIEDEADQFLIAHAPADLEYLLHRVKKMSALIKEGLLMSCLHGGIDGRECEEAQPDKPCIYCRAKTVMENDDDTYGERRR